MWKTETERYDCVGSFIGKEKKTGFRLWWSLSVCRLRCKRRNAFIEAPPKRIHYMFVEKHSSASYAERALWMPDRGREREREMCQCCTEWKLYLYLFVSLSACVVTSDASHHSHKPFFIAVALVTNMQRTSELLSNGMPCIVRLLICWTQRRLRGRERHRERRRWKRLIESTYKNSYVLLNAAIDIHSFSFVSSWLILLGELLLVHRNFRLVFEAISISSFGTRLIIDRAIGFESRTTKSIYDMLYDVRR